MTYLISLTSSLINDDFPEPVGPVIRMKVSKKKKI